MKKTITPPADRHSAEATTPLRRSSNEVVILPVDALDERLTQFLAEVDQRITKVAASASPQGEILTIKEVCSILNISPMQLQKLRDERRIQFSQSGRKIYFLRSDVEQFINEHKTLKNK